MKNLLTLAAIAALLCIASPAFANNNNGCGGGNGGGNHGGGNGGGHGDDDDDDCHGGHNGGHHGGNCGGGHNGGNCGGGHGGGHNDCDDSNLRCDAGGPYTVGAAPGFVQVQLNGLDSDNVQTYTWSTSFPGAFFDNNHSATPTLSIPVGGDCSFQLTVYLTVAKGNKSKSCSTTVRVKDLTPPVIKCPPLAKIVCGDDTSPDALGRATASDDCDSHVQISYSDTITSYPCGADRFDHVITRRWKATDNDCNKSTCVQIIDVVKVIAAMDILPGACPNVYNRSACGDLPVSILGTASFPVGQIKWNTVKIWNLECVGGPVKPESLCFGDVGTPLFDTGCGCNLANGDGRLDLTARFSRNKLNDKLGLDELPAGTVVRLVVSGELCNGCHFIANDCIVIQ